jgi:hypothetical protein
MGAGMGLSLAYLYAQAAGVGRRRFLSALLAISLALGVLQTSLGLRRDGWDLSTDAQSAAGFLAAWGAPPGSVVVARKPHVCFYSGLECVGFPDVRRLDELRANLSRIAADRSPDARVFLFYGFAEKATRPTLARPIRGGARVPWLRRVAEGGQRHMRWVLLEVVREALGSGENGRRPAQREGGRPAGDPEAGIAG